MKKKGKEGTRKFHNELEKRKIYNEMEVNCTLSVWLNPSVWHKFRVRHGDDCENIGKGFYVLRKLFLMFYEIMVMQ